ncbi:MAG: TRAP transporter large permease subunit, partial [Pseudomonadota bacterium]
MLFGLDGIEVGILIVFLTLFAGILSGFPVAFAISGSAMISFAIIASLDSAGLLIHAAVDTGSAEYAAILAEGIRPETVSVFRYPDLPRVEEALFPQGWQVAMDRNISFMVNRMNERVLAGQSIETLLAVAMFVMMGIVLERSRIADELLTTMAKVFGPLPGGLAVSIVIVGAFLAASTGIVGATVVTMGLLALPTMLKNGYSPELSTGVIAASGTLGQIIPPSIVIVLLGTLAGDIYSAAQEDRAVRAGCTDALTYLGEPAVVSVGTLFQAALVPGIMLAMLYAGYAFVYALINPSKAPPVQLGDATQGEVITRNEALTWFLAVPVGVIGLTIAMTQTNLIGSQSVIVDTFTDSGENASLRTRVSDECAASMIALHGQEAWDLAVAQQAAIEEAGGVEEARALTEEERAALVVEAVENAAPIGTGIGIFAMLLAIVFAIARGVGPSSDHRMLWLGAFGIGAMLLADILFVAANTSPGATTVIIAIPLVIIFIGLRDAAKLLAANEILRVVFPPLVLIVAVLGSILGGITNPTPAAALGAGGAILLAAYRKCQDQNRSGRIVLLTAAAIVLMLVLGVNFDMRLGQEVVLFENRLAYIFAFGSFLFAMFGLLCSCWVLISGGVLAPVVRETAKVTSMVFLILIGSQLLNLVLISFGGEHHIQQFLRSFDNEWTVFLLVMLVLFVLGFVLDFLEIIYIV